MGEITEGVCGDGICFLEDGKPLSVSEVKSRLQELSHTKDKLEDTEGLIRRVEFILDNGVICKINSPIDRVHTILKNFLDNREGV